MIPKSLQQRIHNIAEAAAKIEKDGAVHLLVTLKVARKGGDNFDLVQIMSRVCKLLFAAKCFEDVLKLALRLVG